MSPSFHLPCNGSEVKTQLSFTWDGARQVERIAIFSAEPKRWMAHPWGLPWARQGEPPLQNHPAQRCFQSAGTVLHECYSKMQALGQVKASAPPSLWKLAPVTHQNSNDNITSGRQVQAPSVSFDCVPKPGHMAMALSELRCVSVFFFSLVPALTCLC